MRQALGRAKRMLDEEAITRSGAAKRVVEVVARFGLRKVAAAPEREEITAEDVGVVCWMGVLAAAK